MAEDEKLPPLKDTGVAFIDYLATVLRDSTLGAIDAADEKIVQPAIKAAPDWGVKLWTLLNDFDKTGEDSILGKMEDMFLGLGISEDAAKALAGAARKLRLDIAPLRTTNAFFSLVSAVGLLFKMQAGIASPFMERAFAGLVKPFRPDRPSMIQYLWRFGRPGPETTDGKWWDEVLRGFGFDEMGAKVLDGIAKSYLGREDLLELYRRRLSSAAITRGDLKKIGFHDEAQQTQLLAIAETLLDRGTLDELRRRGVLAGPAYRKRLSWLGLSDKSVELAEQAVPRLLGPGELLRAYHREAIDGQQFIDLLGRAGYDKESRDILAEQSYEPLPPEVLLTAMHRGLLKPDDVQRRMQMLGYTSDNSKHIMATSYLLPSPADLIRFGVREVYTPEIRKKFGQDEDFPETMAVEAARLGFSRKTTMEFWAAHWDLPSPTQGFDMFHRGIISRDELKMLLRALDVMPWWRDKLLGISYRLIPRRSLPRLIKQKLITLPDLVERFGALGYSPKNSLMMGRSAVKAAEETKKKLSKAEVIDAYVFDIINKSELTAYLKELDYIDGEAAYYLVKADRKREQRIAADHSYTLTTELKRIRELNKQEILRSYNEGLSDTEAAKSLLSELDFPEVAIDAMLSYETFKSMRENRDAHTKQVKRVFDAGLLTVPEAEQKLIELGYVPTQGRRLTNLWRAERNADTALATQQNKIGTKADYESWLKLGIIDVATWVEAMRRLQFTDETINYNLQEIAAKLGE